ncbi:hypothetical protein GCM10009838_17770 [Catenulispora subtropica]|uniref:Transposase IS701-like DDE domain-containing protein n=1 Tax=Catenulispora subtropica TaxID=450798 RepID=A0ABP5CEY5_9ACTN
MHVENSQVVVCAVWATTWGAAFIDRDLYVPASWIGEPGRCAAAGLPDDLAFATKPVLALGLVERALAAGHRPSWVAADEVYGNDPALRAGLERHRIGYVLAAARSMRISIGPARIRVDEVAAELPVHCWQTRTAGAGAKGPRWYQWAYLHLDDPEPPADGQRCPLIRRNPTTGETAFHRCWSPAAVGLFNVLLLCSSRSGATPTGAQVTRWRRGILNVKHHCTEKKAPIRAESRRRRPRRRSS